MASNKEYTPEEILDITTQFRDMLKHLMDMQSVYDAQVQEMDRAFGDIRHYVELHYPTKRKDKTKVVQVIKNISDTRRKAKDMLEICSAFQNHLSSKDCNEIYTMLGELKKLYTKLFVKDRHYRPRVLFDLFEEENK